MTEMWEDAIQASARVLVRAALNVIQVDPHLWSDRGCQTCRAVGAILGEPFGCYLFAKRKKEEGKGLASQAQTPP